MSKSYEGNCWQLTFFLQCWKHFPLSGCLAACLWSPAPVFRWAAPAPGTWWPWDRGEGGAVNSKLPATDTGWLMARETAKYYKLQATAGAPQNLAASIEVNTSSYPLQCQALDWSWIWSLVELSLLRITCLGHQTSSYLSCYGLQAFSMSAPGSFGFRTYWHLFGVRLKGFWDKYLGKYWMDLDLSLTIEV